MSKPTIAQVKTELSELREEMRDGFARLSTQDALSEQERAVFRQAIQDLVKFSRELVQMRQDLHNLTNTLSVGDGITNRVTRLEEQMKTAFRNNADLKKKHDESQREAVAKASAGSTAIIAALAAAAKAAGLI